jgi:hypothetical protein
MFGGKIRARQRGLSVTQLVRSLSLIGDTQQRQHGAVRNRDREVEICRWGLVGGDGPPDGREGGVEYGVRDEAKGPRVRAAAQASAEGAELGVDLVLQPFGSLLHHGRPATINEVFTTVKQEHSSLSEIGPNPSEEEERRGESGVARGSPPQNIEVGVLEGLGRAEPYLAEQHVARLEPVIDRARRCTGAAGNGTHRRRGGAMHRDETTRRLQNLIVVELRWSHHCYRILILD